MSNKINTRVNEKRNYPDLVHLAMTEENYVPTEEDWQDYEIWCAEMDKLESEREFIDYYDHMAQDSDIDTDNILLQFIGR